VVGLSDTWTLSLTDRELAVDFTRQTALLLGDVGADVAPEAVVGYTVQPELVTLPSGLEVAVCDVRRRP
jgi:hypothetical protein